MTGSKAVPLRLAVGAIWLAALAVAAPSVSAQTENYSYIQGSAPRADEAFTTHGTDLLGHKVNIYTGALEFEQTDVELPGNSSLRVAITRKHVAGQIKPNGLLGNWALELPRIAGNFANSRGWVNGAGSTARCSSYSAPPYIGFVSAYEYWQGTFVQIPGQGGQEVLLRASGNSYAPTDGNTYPLVTKDHWQIRCLGAIQNGAGEGFIARSPSGEEYRFDWMATRSLNAVKNQTTTVGRSEFMLLATQVTDRFGNWVRYAYDAVNPRRLTGLTSSDGRTLTLNYGSNGFVSSVSDGTRTWTYAYGAGTTNTGTELSAVVLPDSSRWEFSLTPMVHPIALELGEGASCNFPGNYPEQAYTGTVKHPSGLLGTFVTQFLTLNRSNVSQWCFGPYPAGAGAMYPQSLVRQGLTSMTITGPGIPSSTWAYQHNIGAASWSPCNPCADTKTVTVTDPRGVMTRHTFGVRFQSNEGQLLSLDEGFDGTSALRTTTYRYRSPSGMAYPEPPGNSIQTAPDFLSIRHRPQDQRSATQQGVTFKWEAAAGAAGFDFRARPATATRSSSLGYTKTETTAYHDNAVKWVLGQIASVTDSSGAIQESHSYNATTAARTASFAFGFQTESSSHHPDGTVQVRYDPAGRGTTFTNYTRGVAQNVVYPDGSAESAIVNNLGRITSHTNAAGTTTLYGYDAMGRLASTTHPNESSLAYHPTTQVFEQVNFAELGLAAGHWRQTVTTGNARKVRYFDALSRERVSVVWDAANPSNTSRYVETRYDVDGRKVFTSYPLRNLAAVDTAIAGTAWAHDGLGRVFRQYQDSELGVLTTSTDYLGSFQRRVTNPRGYITTFAFQAFDTPSEDAIAAVWAPEGSTLSIVRDPFGKPTSITRSGSYGGQSLAATRSYVYDSSQRLCKTIEPETGANVQAYDSANNIAWRASGLALYGTSTCDQASVPAARQISYGYDTRNRLTGTSYGDGSAGIGRSYTADSLPYQVWSAGSTWTYGYNNRRLRSSETMNFGGNNYGLAWGIEAHGNVASLSYPDGAAVAHSPDALGRPTQVSGHASSVSYHPNGLIAGYTLGNGIAHSTSQTTRGLPYVWRDAGVVQDAYAYDANANVGSITDQQEGLSSRSMGYDGLDRLSAANGIWGSGAFGYDPLDNLRTSTVGSRSAVAAIDTATNRLSSLMVNGSVLGFGYDANGNLTARGSQGFAFDIGNRLASAPGKASYAYDGHGRRTWVAYADGSWKLQVYSQAGKLLWSQHSSQGSTRHVYLGDRLIAEVNSATGTSYSHTDALGSPVARTNASGALLGRTRYEPYGATAAGTNPTGIGFTGHVNDADTGLVYMQQRYYEPVAGRFLSVDPVTTDFKSGDHFNRYAYANNNPYKFKDPDGRFGVAGFLIGAGIEAVVQIAVSGSISNPGAVLGAGVSGALTGGLGGALGKQAAAGLISASTATAKTAAAGAAAGVVGKGAEGVVNGKIPSGGDVLGAAIGGGVGAGIGAKIANAPIAKLENIASKEGIVGHVGQTTIQAAQQGGRVEARSSAGQEIGKVAVDAGVAVMSQLAQ